MVKSDNVVPCKYVSASPLAQNLMDHSALFHLISVLALSVQILFLFLDRDVPCSPSYGVYISQLIIPTLFGTRDLFNISYSRELYLFSKFLHFEEIVRVKMAVCFEMIVSET